jgi:hypothetical protein
MKEKTSKDSDSIEGFFYVPIDLLYKVARLIVFLHHYPLTQY